MSSDVPSVPPSNPILGELLTFRRQPLRTIERARAHGDLVRWRFGPMWFQQANHPDLVRDILVTQAGSFHKTPRNKQVFRQIMGEGLLVSDGSYWRKQRKLVQPAFHRQRIEAYGDVMVQHTQRMLAAWRPGETVDLGRAMMKLTLGIVCKTLFDVELDGEAYPRVERAMDVMLERANDRFRRVIMPPPWLPTPGNLAGRRAVAALDEVVMGIIESRRDDMRDQGDLLSMLLLSQAEGDGMSDKEVRDETMTLFLAGHETTANALTWTWTLLARHPRVMQKLVSEVRTVLHGRKVTVDDLDDLPYTEWVVQESMRLYPPVWIIARQAVRPVEVGPYQLDTGAIVFISQWGLHRDERYFTNPLEFRPERFAPDAGATIPRYAYIPFGGGPRVCLGNNFAMMEARLILATMVQAVDLSLAPDQDLTPEPLVTLRPRSRIHVQVNEREPVPAPA